MVDAQSLIDGLYRRFGAGGFAHMQHRAVGASAGDGDALLSLKDASQRRPTGFFAGLMQPCADHLHELIGEHGDEQMSFGPNRLVVIDRSQTEFRFQ